MLRKDLMALLAERAWYTKFQSKLPNIYFGLSGFQSSFLFTLRYVTLHFLHFQDRRGAASISYGVNRAEITEGFYVWTRENKR